MLNWKSYTALALTACVFGTGCTEDDTTEKGSEEAALTGGKDDSFFRPTEHGELNFELPNSADMRDDEVFHAWTFTLSGEATVTLQTEVSKNLDTVMYLYRRDNVDSSWGRYIKKNDDHQKNIWSKIVHNGDAAEYRVIVKPFKTSLRGGFDLVAACEGPGCEAPGAGECVPEEFAGLPAFTDFTDGCVTEIAEVLSSPVKTQRQQFVAFDRHCALPSITQTAVGHYVSWWDDIVGFKDSFGDDEDIEFNVEHTEYENGHVVWVDVQRDEDGMSLIYNKEGELLSVYQSNQSPTVDFFCGKPGAELIELPSAECYAPVTWGIGYDEGEVIKDKSGTGTSDEISELSYFGVKAAMDDYMLSYEDRFGVDHEFDYDITEYDSREGQRGMKLVLNTTDKDGDEVPATYHVIDDFNREIVVRSSSSEDKMICE